MGHGAVMDEPIRGPKAEPVELSTLKRERDQFQKRQRRDREREEHGRDFHKVAYLKERA